MPNVDYFFPLNIKQGAIKMETYRCFIFIAPLYLPTKKLRGMGNTITYTWGLIDKDKVEQKGIL